jgi:TolB protein
MKLSAILVSSCLVTSLCLAATKIEVVKVGDSKSGIDISGLSVSGGENASTFKTVLATDLKRSGWFTVTESGKGTYRIAGSCVEEASVLQVRCDVTSPALGQRFLKESYQGSSDKAASLAHKVSDAIVWAVKQKKGIASTRILMIGSRDGKKDLYICDYDGRNLSKVTQDGAICLSPNWHPDGNRAVYTSYHEDRPMIYLVGVKEKSRKRIVEFPGLNTGADISPDGGSMALTLSKDGNPELYVMGMGGGRLTRLTVSQRATEASPTWSPDGKSIAFVCDKTGSPQIYVKDRNGGADRQVSLIGRENVAPDWGPDNRLVWTTRREGRYQLCVMDPSRGREEVVPDTSDGFDYEDPSWAPDGRHIVCSRTGSFHSDVYILDTMGDPPIRITTLKGDWYSPVWSPK